MHNHMGIRQFFVNFFNDVNSQNFTIRFTGEFISAVRSTDSNGQSIQLGFGNKAGCLVRIGNQTFFIDNAFSAVTVFFIAFTGFQRADDAQFAFNGSADGMRTGNNFLSDVNVIFKRRRCFAVSFQRTVHHDGRITVDNGRLADINRRAMILMQTNRQFGEHFDTGGNHMANHRITGKFTGTGRGLQNNRSVNFFGCLQNSDILLHLIDIKSRNAVVVFGGMGKNLTHCN